MIEALIRLIPRWVLPAILAAAGWLFFVHSYVSEILFTRMTLPLVRETTAEAKAYADYHGFAVSGDDVSAFLRCTYGTVYATDDFRFGFSVYVASAGIVGSDALDHFKDRLDSILQAEACGKPPWQKT